MTKAERLEKAKQTRLLNQMLVEKTEMTDEEKLNISTLFPQWDSFTSFEIGNTCLYLEEVYEVLQAHTRQDDWTPDVSVSLFRHITLTDEGIEVYDPNTLYSIGDKVSYNDVIYVSVINNNSWSPEEYSAGWELC